MTKFNVGDRVRLINGNLAAKVGAEAVVTERNYENSFAGELIRVKWDRTVNNLVNNQMDGGYSSSSFELVQPQARAEYIISLKETGKYVPAPFPKVYSSEAQALAVADKMARAHGGEFVVFKTIASTIIPPAPAPVVRRFA